MRNIRPLWGRNLFDMHINQGIIVLRLRFGRFGPGLIYLCIFDAEDYGSTSPIENSLSDSTRCRADSNHDEVPPPGQFMCKHYLGIDH